MSPLMPCDIPPTWDRSTTAASAAVERERRRCGVARPLVRDEAHGDRAAHGNGVRVRGWGDSHRTARLGRRTAPHAGDALAVGEGEGELPAVDRGGAGVADL